MKIMFLGRRCEKEERCENVAGNCLCPAHVCTAGFFFLAGYPGIVMTNNKLEGCTT